MAMVTSDRGNGRVLILNFLQVTLTKTILSRIPSHRKKHAVTVGEILRRVESPETLNISMLGPILRKAKSKNGSLYLRQKLQRIGIELPQGRRKTAHSTLFTLLTESKCKSIQVEKLSSI